MQHPRARNTDPAVSHAAANQVQQFVGKHADRIYSALSNYGAMTKDEIADKTGLTPVQVDRRLPEMQREGDVEPTGEVRQSKSGREERVWRIKA